MKRALVILAVSAVWTLSSAWAQETAGVDGSSTRYPVVIERAINGKQVHLCLTGTALRKKMMFSVYAVASYLEEGVAVGSAEDLAQCNAGKQLHLVMERDVSGKDMADAFEAAIRANYPAPAHADELARFKAFLQQRSAHRADQIRLTHLPDVGLNCAFAGKGEITIEGVEFSKAVWDIYLGRNNLGDSIKKGLVSRLR